MPRFICNNKNCENTGKTELIAHVRFIWNDDTKRLEAKEATCESCGMQRDVVKEGGNIVIPWFKPDNAKNYQNKTVSKKPNQYNY